VLPPTGIRRALLACGLAIASAWWAPAPAAEKAAFWIEPRASMLIDSQTVDEIAPRAGIIVLRTTVRGPAPGYALTDVVGRIKRKAPAPPVLSYAWLSRQRSGGRIEGYLFRGLNINIPLVTVDGGRDGKVAYLDVTDAAVRKAVVERLASERERLGVDGFAVDLVNRLPDTRPKPLANICNAKPGFCDIYAKSMDELIATLNAALGDNGTLIFNGLRSFEPGVLEQQSRLLEQADGAAIAGFGLVPGLGGRGFKADVLAYLDAAPRWPADKPVLFFGRGPWGYIGYEEDYRRQRYLYASFLLARRPVDMFKYLSSFQVPAHAGRAGGLDFYADWNVDLGAAEGPYRVERGLYLRNFSGGRVAVAPDDGGGGTLRLDSTYYTPEGRVVSGEVRLTGGEGLILLNARQRVPEYPPRRHIDAVKIAGWGWAQSSTTGAPGSARVRLAPLPAGLEWEHDLLLDYERSLVPFERLEVDAALAGPGASLLAVADVDDPKGEHMRAVIVVAQAGLAGGAAELGEAVQYRTQPRPTERWPRIAVQYQPGAKSVLDGPALFASTPYRFRRWSHLRLTGPLDVAGITLERRAALVPAR
jgi:hypothetical protein